MSLNPRDPNPRTSISSKTLLVTGGAGYIGAVLVPKLLQQGYRVRVFDLFMYIEVEDYRKAVGGSENLELIEGDLRDKELVEQSLDGVDMVLHLAGISNDPSSDLNPQLTIDVNVTATKQLIDLSFKKGVKRFINASSSSVYGVKEEPDVTEDLSLNPLTVYSESKVIIEQYLKQYKGKMEYVSVRSATVCGYSPRMRLDLTVNILTHHAVERRKILVFGGSQKRPNVHIQDISDFYVLLAKVEGTKIDGEAFNVCAANSTVMDLAKLVQSSCLEEIPIEVTETDDLRSYHISADKAESVLSFRAKQPIQGAIDEVRSALESKDIHNTDSSHFYNVRRMKQLQEEGDRSVCSLEATLSK